MSTDELSLSAPAALAAEHGLTPIGRQPSLPAYIRSLWDRRHFTLAYARAQVQAENAESRLGQLWQVLNPLLNAAVYYLVFGVILGAKSTVPNYIGFLVTGVFVFTFSQRIIQSGSRAITGNLGLVRALYFPRAVLPLATAMEEVLKMGVSLAVLGVIMLFTGGHISYTWLQIPLILVLQLMFSAGIGMVFARLTTAYRDVAQFLPFALRVWMYLSGVMYSIEVFIHKHDAHPWIDWLLTVNPAAVYIELMRGAFGATTWPSWAAPPMTWVYGVVWAVVASFFGFVFFWRAESKYGRG